MAGFVVVLDANVLYGVEVTDFFATMAARRLFRPHWSPQILDEVVRNLALRPDLDPAAIDRRLEPFGVEAVRADDFALAQVDLHHDGVRASITAMSARRRRAPRTPDEIVEVLGRYLPAAMAALRRGGSAPDSSTGAPAGWSDEG